MPFVYQAGNLQTQVELIRPKPGDGTDIFLCPEKILGG